MKMHGFDISANGKQFQIALDSGSFGLIIDCRYGKGKIIINGMDKNLEAYKWYESQLENDSSISIKIGEIDSISEPIKIIETRISNEEKIKIQTERELKAFKELRQELIDEGLIDS